MSTKSDSRQQFRVSRRTIKPTLVAVATIAAITVAVLAVLPNFARVRVTKSQRNCVANLRLIAGAKAAFADAHGATNGTAVTKEELMPYLEEWPKCPQGGEYSAEAIGKSPKCSNSKHHDYTP